MPQVPPSKEGDQAKGKDSLSVREMKPKCKICSSPWHYKTFCLVNPKNSKKIRERSKPIQRVGKEHRKWETTRARWFRENPADHYICYLGGCYLTPEQTTLDHVEPRSGSPSLRHEFSNLKPACGRHNSMKGSMSVEQFFTKYPELKYFSPLYRSKPLET